VKKGGEESAKFPRFEWGISTDFRFPISDFLSAMNQNRTIVIKALSQILIKRVGFGNRRFPYPDRPSAPKKSHYASRK
jgi:hypothetical protein